MTLLEKSKKLVELRNTINDREEELNEILRPIKQERDYYQREILEELKNTEQFSARFDFATITRAVRKTSVILDENAVMEWLDKNGLKKEYTAIRLIPAFDALAKQTIKEGKVIDGIEIHETEYISIKSSDKEDKRKVVID